MIASSRSRRPPTTRCPYKFEAGTPNIAGVVGLGAAIDYLSAIDRHAALARTRTTCSPTPPSALRDDPGRCASSARRAQKAGVLSFVLEGVHPHDVGTILDREGIAVRTGQHCAQPVMDRFGVPATSRASLGSTTRATDDRRAVAALRQGARRCFGMRHVGAQAISTRKSSSTTTAGRGTSARSTAPTRTQEGYNPLCGDRLTLYVTLDGDASRDVAFQGQGCAISKASASLMTEALKGKTVAKARDLFDRFHAMITPAPDSRGRRTSASSPCSPASASSRRA